MFRHGSRKLTAFFASIFAYLILMLSVIIFIRPQNISLESFAVTCAAGVMVISYGFYASNAFEHTGSSFFTRKSADIIRQKDNEQRNPSEI